MRALSFSVVILAGCAVEEAPEIEPEVLEVPPGATPYAGCSDWMCGSNSPVVNYRHFHDLHLGGLPNDAGYRIVGYRHPMYDEVKMRVVGAEIELDTSSGPVNGPKVRGLQIDLKHDASGDNNTITIAEVGATPFFARIPGTPPTMLPSTYTYTLTWSGDGAPPVTFAPNVCSNPNNGDSTLGMNQTMAVLTEGDRVDSSSKVVYGSDITWFNIGCASHALAKMHLTGHSQAAKRHGFTTTRDERTTMLKMLSGDYCGRGKPFTVAGMPLVWKDDREWMGWQSGARLEARWTSRGVACLNTPRLEEHPELLADTEYGSSVIDDITAACGGRLPPRCNLTFDTYHLYSGHP